MNWQNQFVPKLADFAKWIAFDFAEMRVEVAGKDCDFRRILNKLFYALAPILSAVVFYQYLKYLLVFNACRYEESARKRSGYFRKLSKQLMLLLKRYGNFYFRFVPMNHGTTLPQTCTVFAAIREVLSNANRPATRRFRTSLLFHLIQGNRHYSTQNVNFPEVNTIRRDYDEALEESDPLSYFNVDIMKCSREMIIQGVKDFDVMSTIFRVLETATEEMEH